MGGWDRSSRLFGLLALCAAMLQALPCRPDQASAGFAAEAPALGVRVRDGEVAAVVLRALAGASRRLAEPACQELFRDFSDASGQRLDDILAERGRTAAEHLNHLYFYDAPGHLRCDSRRVLAVTAVGSHVVFVCSQQLLKGSRRGKSVGELMVIHELLHSLGLGEDPPSSAAINARVIGRCGP